MARSTTEEMILSASGGTPMGRQPETRARRTQRENAVALGAVPLFADFTKRHLVHLAKEADELDFQPGERIVEEGMLGETLFVVISGKAKVVRGGKKVGEVVPGDFFGELSALDGGPRTASVIADTPVRVLRLFRHTLTELLREEPPLMLKLLTGIVRRIRQIERTKG